MHRIAILLWLGGCLCLGSCAEPTPPSILLVTIDTVRPDHLGCYGHREAHTPALDALAADGILFENAASPYPLTLPAHASILSGRHPFGHALRDNAILDTPPLPPMLPQLLAKRGYRSAAVISAFVLDARFGLSEGFAIYDDDLGGNDDPHNERNAQETTARAIALLDQLEGESFFLWVHYFDAHAPYASPAPDAPAAGSDARLRYDAEISYMDAHIGRLLDELRARGLYDDMLVACAGDHGEAFGEHGEREHGYFVYETTLRVPLLLKLPAGERAGERIDADASLIDLAPTLLALAGADAPAMPHARDLRGLSGDERRPLYAETLSPFSNHGASPLASVRLRPWKYIEAPEAELYELEQDPLEDENRAPTERAERARMRAVLEEFNPLDWMQRADPLASRREDPESARRLRALGYTGGAGASAERIDRPDPKHLLTVLALIERGNSAVASAELEIARDAYIEALALDPRNWKACWKLARVYEDLARPDDAIAVYRDALERSPRLLSANLNLAVLLHRLGRNEEALEEIEICVRGRADYAPAHTIRGGILHALGRTEAARGAWEESLRLRPDQEDVRRALESLAPTPGN